MRGLTKSEEELKKTIKEFIDRFHTHYFAWCVGTSDDPEKKLITVHNVKEKESFIDAWTFEWAADDEVARRVRRYFVEDLGTIGYADGEDEYATAVYAYMTRSHTMP